MIKKFIGIRGNHNVGKTHDLNEFIERNNGIRLPAPQQKALCLCNNKTVFLRTSSPNERAGNSVSDAINLLEKDLDFFEKIAHNCKVDYLVVVMALTIYKKKDTTPQVIQEVKDKGYDYDEIFKNSKPDRILNKLESHHFFR